MVHEVESRDIVKHAVHTVELAWFENITFAEHGTNAASTVPSHVQCGYIGRQIVHMRMSQIHLKIVPRSSSSWEAGEVHAPIPLALSSTLYSNVERASFSCIGPL